MSKYTAVIDSSVLLGYKTGHPGCQNLFYKAIDGEIEIIISPLSVSKIWSSQDFDRKSEIGYLSLLEFMTVSPIDVETATKTGHTLRENSTNINIDLEAANIVSICNISGHPLVTTKPELYDDLFDGAINCEEAVNKLN
ncbi:MAG: hypothetical protein VX918_04270 [Chloroflexota bacterium]|jgi:hypothetical protein|nr:hypothetical protein [Chloroflexota bacterium]HBR64874.1 hypothetical protein [Dehalococcoidia bacterium]|tara:strand:- start:1738 stop:2154 length:417 start_codon:yes stop_codon:yes gene_type:complete